MKKRQFLSMAALAAGATPAFAGRAVKAGTGPALLTVSGAIARSNRGPFDPALDQLMHKQKISFDKAFAFDFTMLLKLPAINIKPTLEYDARAHALRGPLLLDVVAMAGAHLSDTGKLVLRSVDGYAATATVAQLRAQRFIVATHLDGQPMPLGGLGPLWAVYDADRVPNMAAKPLPERFGACPWALYHIHVDYA
jgi:hypothetical protein